MNITHWERGRFWVGSETHPRQSPYLVDLLEYHLNGKCDCMDFRIHREPKLSEDRKSPRQRCKHILAVLNHIADRVQIKVHWRRRVPWNEAERLVVAESVLANWARQEKPKLTYARQSPLAPTPWSKTLHSGEIPETCFEDIQASASVAAGGCARHASVAEGAPPL